MHIGVCHPLEVFFRMIYGVVTNKTVNKFKWIIEVGNFCK